MAEHSSLHDRCAQAREKGRAAAREARKTGASRESVQPDFTDPHVLAAWRDGFDAEWQHTNHG